MFLTKPILHVSGITPAVSDSDLITALHECLRARLKINREGSRWEPTTGVVEFEKLENGSFVLVIFITTSKLFDPDSF